MANWTKNEPQGTSQRKKWNLEDRTSLNNLKYYIAEDGCSDIQYDLARQLLEGDEEEDATEKYTQGIKWLLRAAHQGHADALILLSECYKNRRGINDRNECEVEKCLSMSASERAARKAARELFACLSNGEEYITATHLERKMREIYKMQKKKHKYDDSECDDNRRNNATATTSTTMNGDVSPSRPTHHHQQQYRNNQYSPSQNNNMCDSDLITEANLVSAAVNYSNGYLPPVTQALTLSIPHPLTLDHIPYFHRLLFHPILFFSLYYHHFIKLLTSISDFIIDKFYIFSLILIYTFLISDDIIMFVPLGFYYLSLIIMIISSFKMIKTKHDFIDFRMWSGLFLSYGDHNIDSNNSENQFLRNNMKPYLLFFVAFFINIVLNPIVSDQWIPHSEITVISFILIFITMFTFMYSSDYYFPDLYILFSFGINVLAKYPYEMDSVVKTGWRFLDLKIPNFPSFVIGNGIEFCLNCRTLFYLLIPGCLILLAYRRNWHGIYQYLIPHCVTISWLQICIISSQCATMFGLIRATLGLAGLLLFLPLFGIVTLMIPIFALIEWLSLTDSIVNITATIGIGIVASIGSCFMAKNRRTDKYITVLHVTLCIFAIAFLILPHMTSDFESSHGRSTNLFESIFNHHKSIDEHNHHHHYHHHHNMHDDNFDNNLNWDIYYKYCNQPAWQHVNKINTQIRCSQFDGVSIKWEGKITNIEINKVQNIRADFITNYLPEFIGDLIKCIYGEQNQVNCSEEENCDDIKDFIEQQKKCNLNHWNYYEYNIIVRMHSGIFNTPTEILIRAQHNFGNFTQRLNNSDLIWFKGILRNTNYDSDNINNNRFMILGRDNKPIIDLLAIGCLSCHNKNLDSYQLIADRFKITSRIKDLNRGIKYLLNVIFNPLVTFK